MVGFLTNLLAMPVTLCCGWHAALNEHMCPIRRHKRLKFHQGSEIMVDRVVRAVPNLCMYRTCLLCSASEFSTESGLREGLSMD